MSRFAKGVLSRCQTWHMTLQYVAYRSVKGALSHRERTPFTFYRVMYYNCKVYKTLTYSDLSKNRKNGSRVAYYAASLHSVEFF